MESHKRTLIKTIVFRIIATCITISVVYIWSKDLSMATGAGLVSNLLKGIFYYIHERIWNKIDYGRTIPRS